MFLKETIDRNPELVTFAQSLGLPDTYVIDVDTFVENAKKIKDAAKDIDCYFMLKQVGRNPYLAKKLMEIDYPGCVAVDFREALTMINNGIHICNVGHLVQIPKALIKTIISARPDFVTCYSLDKINEINDAAKELGITQKILIKVVDDDDILYPGQEAGFKLDELIFPKFSNCEITGVTAFPCFLENEPTHNLETLFKAKEMLGVEHVNAPSCNCVEVAKSIQGSGITSIEPGHALTGTTPVPNQVEIPSVVYTTEVSHIYDNKSYIYGGGFYRRGHTKYALVNSEIVNVEEPALDSIDYYFKLNKKFSISSPVVMAFRFQIFVTRSQVALVEGLHTGSPKVIGIYSSLGEKING
ncbi:MAG: alanine racemase [Coriobacteriia bacterium]|nr:alanine racemase [Coriobacteriia bacterium]